MTPTGLSAEAVWGVLEPLGWSREDRLGSTYFHPANESAGLITLHEIADWLDITVWLEVAPDFAPALAALSRLLGGDA